MALLNDIKLKGYLTLFLPYISLSTAFLAHTTPYASPYPLFLIYSLSVLLICTTTLFPHSPLEEIRVLCLPDQAGTHHDRLEALSLDRPQIALTDGGNCCRSLAIVEYCQFAENLCARQC